MVFVPFTLLGCGLLLQCNAFLIPATIGLPNERAMDVPTQYASWSAPHFVVYSDFGIGFSSPPPPSMIKVRESLCYFVNMTPFSINRDLILCAHPMRLLPPPLMMHRNLAFLLLEGPWDNVIGSSFIS